MTAERSYGGIPVFRELLCARMRHAPPDISAAARFKTPASTITAMGLSFVLRRSRKQTAKMPKSTQFVSASVTAAPSPQKAVIKMETPAEVIMATTAGRSVERAVFEIQPRDERHKDAGRKDGTDGRGDGAGDPGQLISDGSGRGLRDGDQVEHFIFLDPVELIDEFALHQRHDHIAAAEGKRAEIQCGPEQLPQDFFLLSVQPHLMKSIAPFVWFVKRHFVKNEEQGGKSPAPWFSFGCAARLRPAPFCGLRCPWSSYRGCGCRSAQS